jgi:hypothetical protein
MKKACDTEKMRDEYDFSGGVRGKHYRAFRRGHVVKVGRPNGAVEVRYFSRQDGAVMLDPDVRRHFRSSKSVNNALRALVAAH